MVVVLFQIAPVLSAVFLLSFYMAVPLIFVSQFVFSALRPFLYLLSFLPHLASIHVLEFKYDVTLNLSPL